MLIIITIKFYFNSSTGSYLQSSGTGIKIKRYKMKSTNLHISPDPHIIYKSICGRIISASLIKFRVRYKRIVIFNTIFFGSLKWIDIVIVQFYSRSVQNSHSHILIIRNSNDPGYHRKFRKSNVMSRSTLYDLNFLICLTTFCYIFQIHTRNFNIKNKTIIVCFHNIYFRFLLSTGIK